MCLPTDMTPLSGGAKGLGKTGVGGGGCWKVAGRDAGRGSSVGRVCWKGAKKAPEGVPALEGSAGRLRWKGFHEVLYPHSVLFQATVDVWLQLVQWDESVAEP